MLRIVAAAVASLVWVFALVMAYPFIPGSHSDAFKGISVFFGVLVTLEVAQQS